MEHVEPDTNFRFNMCAISSSHQQFNLTKDVGEYRCYIENEAGVTHTDEAQPLYVSKWRKYSFR